MFADDHLHASIKIVIVFLEAKRKDCVAMGNHPEILLESGTNEFEIMNLTIAGETFGINVAKVREIMMACR